jgi:outer membrane protein OmpA-like peptidoglycan-associated protein
MRKSFRVVLALSLCGWFAKAQAAEGTPPAGPPAVAGTASSADATAASGGSAPRAAQAPGALGLPSLVGPIGLYGVSTAEVGPVHQLRVGLHAEYFSASDFLVAGDSQQRLRGELAFGFTPHRRFELFGALLNASNRNDRARTAADRDPELLKSYGDLVLGAKGVYPLSPAATLGFELGLKFLAGVSNLTFSPSSTSLWVGPLLTYDLRNTQQNLPVRVHAGVNYYLDNSSNLRDLSGLSLNAKEAALFGYGISPSRLRVAVAADVPLGNETLPVPIDPFVEYHFEYATGSADKSFAAYAPPACGSTASSQPCVDNRDSHWVTLGVRADVFRGLTADVGVEVRLRSPGFPYGPPVPPYNVVFGLSVPVDLDALARPRVVTRTVEVPAPPRRGAINGQVRGRDGAPISGAIIIVGGHPHANAATDGEGAFTTIELDPGPIDLQVSASGFESSLVQVPVAAGRTQSIGVTLVPKPPTAILHGRAIGRDGRGLAATIKVAGQGKTGGIFELHGDATGAYAVSLPAGSYRVRAEAPPLQPQEAQLELAANQDKTVDFVWRPGPATASITLADGIIRLPQPIHFVGVSAKLAPDAQRLLDGVADFLNSHPEVRRVEVVAHWDDGVAKEAADTLTQQQAEAVRGYLLARGIAGDRLVAQGAGSSQPLVPVTTPASRLKNRRVELRAK